MQDKPALFSTFMLWMLATLYHDLPEVGDVDKPKLVFFFDEAHLHLRRREQGAARSDRAGGAADPLEGSRRLLHHAESEGRAGDGARPARASRAARAACVHPRRREGAQGRGAHLPEDEVLRHRGDADDARHRRGARHRARRRTACRRRRSRRGSSRRRRAWVHSRTTRCSSGSRRRRRCASTRRRSIARARARC